MNTEVEYDSSVMDEYDVNSTMKSKQQVINKISNYSFNQDTSSGFILTVSNKVLSFLIKMFLVFGAIFLFIAYLHPEMSLFSMGGLLLFINALIFNILNTRIDKYIDKSDVKIRMLVVENTMKELKGYDKLSEREKENMFEDLLKYANLSKVKD